MKNRLFVSVLGIAGALVLLLAVNLLASKALTGMRLDLTEGKLFTLSQGSRNVLAQIEEPVTLRLYRSTDEAKKYLGGYGQRVEEFLREFETASGGKLEVEVLDPEPYSETEEKAVQAGLRAFGGPPLGADEQLYFGVVGSNTVGDQKVLPFLSPGREAFLEYDVSKLVHDLAHPEKTVVGVMSSLPIEGQVNPFMPDRNAPQPWMVVEQIREFYEVKSVLPNATSIPDDVQVLLVVHPKGLPEPAQYAIDQFVLRGGKALVFADPWCEVDVPPSDPNNPLQAMMASRGSELPKLFQAWGVTMPKDKLAVDRAYAAPVTYNNNGRMENVAFVAWVQAHGEAFSKEEVPTSQLEVMMLQYPGFLEPAEGATTTFTPLIRTSEESMELATSAIQFSKEPAKLLADFQPSGTRMTLAARITGKAKTAFPDGKPAAAPGAEPEPEPDGAAAEHLAESKGDIAVIVVADADMLHDDTWVRVMNFVGTRIPQKTSDNGDFVMNAIDFLGGSTDLVSLRARGSSAYPMLVVEELKRKAEQNLRAEEQNLVEEKQRTERELNDLLSKAGADAEQVLMSAEAQAKVESLRGTLVDTSRRLRQVRYDLSKDVEGLGATLKRLNILLPPLLVIAAALLVFVFRANRRKAA